MKELFPISDDGMIIEWFSRANLYGVPRVTVSTLVLENDTQKITVCPLSITFDMIQI